MDSKKYMRYGMITTMAMGAVVGWSVAMGNVVLLIAVMVAGMALLYLYKSRVTEVMEDELVYMLSEKASSMAMRVFGGDDGINWFCFSSIERKWLCCV